MTKPLNVHQFFSRRHSSEVSTTSGLLRFSNFYRVPTAIATWDQAESDTAPSVHASWNALFFDLIYVAVAFKEGSLLFESIKNNDIANGMLLFVATFVALYECWEFTVQVAGRIHYGDVFHKFWDIFGLLVVAAAALHLAEADLMLNASTGYAVGFSACKLLSYCVSMTTSLELYVMGKEKNIRAFGWSMFCREIVKALFTVAALVLSVYDNVRAAVWVWLAAYLYGNLELALRIMLMKTKRFAFLDCLRFNQTRGVPVVIDFMIHRYGEWTILMLGEGVLQIIIAQIAFEAPYYVSFVAAYLTMALLQLLHYATEPNKAKDHCFRLSAPRAITWKTFQVVYSLALISIGVGLKSALKKESSLHKPEYAKYRHLLCISLAVGLTTLFICKLLHRGVLEFQVEVPSGEAKKQMRLSIAKILIWAAKFVVSISVGFVGYASLDGWALTLICVVFVGAAFGLQVLNANVDKLRSRIAVEYKLNLDEVSSASESVADGDDLAIKDTAKADEGNDKSKTATCVLKQDDGSGIEVYCTEERDGDKLVKILIQSSSGCALEISSFQEAKQRMSEFALWQKVMSKVLENGDLPESADSSADSLPARSDDIEVILEG